VTRSRNYKLPKFVQAWVDRDGRAYHYFRRRGSPRVRLPGLPWSPEFMAAYQRALDASKRIVGKRGSVAHVVASYVLDDNVLHELAHSTLSSRRHLLQNFARDHGHKLVASVTTAELTQMFAPMQKRGAAENLLKAIRGLMKWCVEQGLLKTDPSAGVKLKRRKSPGFHTWSEDEIAQFEFHHAIGTKARLAFALLLYTAQRRGDVIRMGRQHLRDCKDEHLRALGIRSVLPLRQKKTGTQVEVPIHPELQAIIDATPSEHLTFIVNAWGKPFTPGAFSNWFREQCDAAGLPKVCSAHGLRKAACVRLAHAGCTVHQIMGISGHTSIKEVERYTMEAERARLAGQAMATVIKARPKVSKKDGV
jgi:integrase